MLIGGLGMGPAKYETRIDVPIDGSMFAWAVPSFDGGSGRAASLELVFPESGVHVRSAVVEDVAAVASENLSDRIAWISTRSAVRGLLKRQLADQLKSDEDTAWAGLAIDIFTIVSERADLRAWRTLPRAWVAAAAQAKSRMYQATIRRYLERTVGMEPERAARKAAVLYHLVDGVVRGNLADDPGRLRDPQIRADTVTAALAVLGGP